MAKRGILSYLILKPISIVYGWVVAIRNAMFERGMLKQTEFDIPVITVGNISVGGSGKTPHTEYILDKLSEQYRIGMLSRGYKRRTKGFVLGTENTHVEDIGDEPYQVYKKFRDRGVMVAVCEKRVDGIERMREIDPDLEMIVLDDAFQHRYVKPRLAVVLMEFTRLPHKDSMLPFGRLREPVSALNRADVVVITKCPEAMTPLQKRVIASDLNLFPYQKLLFSRYKYLPPVAVFREGYSRQPRLDLDSLTASDTLLSVTGVANPRPFVRQLRCYKAKVKIKRFSDHHNFTHSDMESINEKFTNMVGKRKYILTTEKDAMRLMTNPYFPHHLRKYIYYLPIRVSFEDDNEQPLENVLDQLLRNNSLIR
ncbi:MAG: tetraacyldisaccharide 4'-kinase [Paramuribaculum sp.]|nr:tetraacyldisaccharide 4'-kinase [Paramuribaculum sp.]